MKYIALILIGILTACSSSTFKQEQRQINAVIIQYDSLLQSVKNIDISSSGPNLKRYKDALAYSKSKLSTDSIPNLNTMTYLNNLKLMKRQFRNAPNQKKVLQLISLEIKSNYKIYLTT